MPITGTELSTISTNVSAGSGDSGKIVLLNSSGLVDDSMLPAFGAGSITTVAAGSGISVTGGTGPTATVSAAYGSTSTTVCVGNDTRLSNDRTASGIRTATTVVAVSTAAAPSAGQVLAAIDSSSAHWVAPTAGADGTTWYWYSTSEVMTDSDGVDGDYAIIVAGPTGNGNIYQKVGGHWTAIGNIRGGDGIAGTQIRSGTTAPDDGIGVNGDFYLRTDTGQFYKMVSGTYTLVLTMQLALTYSTGLNLTGTTLTVVYGTTSTTACVGNDSRLSDARTPTSHATSHKSGGGDAIKLDELSPPTDITTLNASTSAHGLLPKLNGVSTTYLDGTGAFTTPAGGGGGSSISGRLPLYFHPASPNGSDEEFESTTAPSGWELRDTNISTTITPSGAVDPYTTPTTGTARASYHTDWRSSFASIQLAADGHNIIYAKPITVPTNVFIWASFGTFARNSGNASGGDGQMMMGFFADSSSHPILSQSVCLGFRNPTGGNVNVQAFTDGSSVQGNSSTNVNASHSGPWQYYGIQKLGTAYHCWLFDDAGNNQHYASFTETNTMGWIGFYIRCGVSTDPAAGIHRMDFLRRIDSSNTLPF